MNKESSAISPGSCAAVVGQEASLRRMTSAILRQQGFMVQEALSMTELEEAFQNTPNAARLIVANTDGQDQNQLLDAAVRLRSRHQDMKIILTSASCPDSVELDCMRRANIDFMSLPFSFARFSKAIASVPRPVREVPLVNLPLPVPSLARSSSLPA